MPFPVFWLALAYAAGLALFAGVDDSPRTLFLLATLALLMGVAVLRRRWLRATLVCALAGFFLLGSAVIALHAAGVAPNRIDRLVAASGLDLSEAVRLVGWLRRAPEQKPFATIYELELESIETGGHRHPTAGGVRLSYFLPPEPDPRRPPLPALHYGDRVEALLRVHPPITHYNPGSFDRKTYLARRGIFLEGSLKDPALIVKLPGRRGQRAIGWIQTVRTHLLARLDQLVPPNTRPDRNAVLRAMLLGDRGFLSHRQKENFRLSGAYHVLVISGLHVAVIALFIFWLLRRRGGPEWVASLVTIAVLIFYLLLVEDRPPIERAVWMVSLYLLARLLFREVSPANPLALAALLVLFVHPQWLFEASLHFSFGAVFLIAFFAVPWMERTSAPYRHALGFLDAPERDDQLRPPRLVQFRHDLRLLAELLGSLLFWRKEKEGPARRLLVATVRLGLRVWEFFLISFAIYLGFVLLTAVYFNRVVWIGLLTNILVVPLVSLIVPLGLAALLLGAAWPAAGVLLMQPASRFVGVLLGIVDALAGRWVSYGIPPPPLWVALLYLATLVLLGVAVARQRHQRWAGLMLAGLILVVVTHPFPPRLAKGALEVTVLDVGQGDSLFIAFPNRETWLVDAGRGPVEIPSGYRVGEPVGETVVAPYLRARGLKRLDHLWLTHAHHDHMAGLLPVLDEFPVGRFHVGRNPESKRYRELLEKVRARGIPLAKQVAGDHWAVGDVTVAVLWPSRDRPLGRSPSNNDSLVLRLCRDDTCILLPGDIEPAIEKKLAGEKASLAAAVLKVPHHGGRGAASREFLARVAPRVAIVSVGATNPFGHPFDAVQQRLKTEVKQVYRTDRDGGVTVRVEAGGVRVRSYRPPERTEAELYPNLWAKLAACARRLVPLE